VPEDLLWVYELDLLEAKERDAVMEMIAASGEAQAQLEKIRDTLATSGELAPMQKAKAVATGFLQDLMDTGVNLCAVVVRVGEELVAPFLSCGWNLPAFQPAYCLGEKLGVGPGAGAREPSRRQDIQAPDGTRITILSLPEDKYEVQVRLPKGVEGGVQFRQLTPKSEGSGFRERLVGQPPSTKLFPCPKGLLKIVCQNGNEYVIAVASSSDKSTDDKDSIH